MYPQGGKKYLNSSNRKQLLCLRHARFCQILEILQNKQSFILVFCKQDVSEEVKVTVARALSRPSHVILCKNLTPYTI